MKAITVRDTNGILICFGPSNGNYDPGVPVGTVKAVEDSYEVVLAEWYALRAQDPVVQTLEEKVNDLQVQVGIMNATLTAQKLTA